MNTFRRLSDTLNFAARWREHVRREHDIYAMQCLAGFDLGYVPWTSSAMRPSGLRLAVNEVILHQRKEGLEFGAGISSLFLAKAFELVGGRLTIVEHSSLWLEKIRGDLLRIGIMPDTCNLVHAPLRRIVPAALDSLEWYDRGILEQALRGTAFDFCLVDGPIATDGNLAVRAPAGIFIKERLSSSYALIVDDIDRPKDLELAHEWMQALGGRISVYSAMGCIAIIRPKSEIAYNIG